MSDIVREFKAESLALIEQMLVLLEICETPQGQPSEIEKFGLFADRIMGSAKQLSFDQSVSSVDLTMIVQLSELCKILGYKSAKLKPQEGLWSVAVGVLLDATDELRRLIAEFQAKSQLAGGLAAGLIARLKWLNEQFAADIDGGVPMSQVQNLLNHLKSDSND